MIKRSIVINLITKISKNLLLPLDTFKYFEYILPLCLLKATLQLNNKIHLQRVLKYINIAQNVHLSSLL